MSITYTPSTNFGSKDSLPTNDPDKVIKGSEFSTEFTAIQTAFGLAAPAASPTFTGTVTIASVDINGGTIDGVTIGGSSAEAGSFTTLTTSGAVTHNGGTANGVAYLNGSKVLTTGSALTFDGTDFATTGGVLLNNSQYYYGKNAAGSAVRLMGINSGNVNYIGAIDSGPTDAIYGAASTFTNQAWYVGGSEQMRLTSTGLGIGTTSPGESLETTGNIQIKYFGQNTDPSGARYLIFNNTDTTLVAGQPLGGLSWVNNDASATAGEAAYVKAYAATNTGSSELRFGTGAQNGATEAMRIDSSGNLSLNSNGSIASLDGVSGMQIGNSTASSSGLALETLDRGYLMYINGSSLRFWDSTDNSDRMTLDSSGNLLVGTTTASAKLTVEGSGSAAQMVRGFATNASYTGQVIQSLASRNTTNESYEFLRCSVNGVADRLKIYDNGNVENTNNSYGSLSDIKLKENVVDASAQWDDIKGLRFRKYNFKEETGQSTHTQMGLIAQEAELVCPGIVKETTDRDQEGNDLGTTTKSIQYSLVYVKAVKALQEAMARIETLEAEVAALKGA